MFGSGVLDTAIGLIFVFLLVSTLVTIGNEFIASILSSRAKWLLVGIQKLVGPELAKELYAHPLIGGAQAALDVAQTSNTPGAGTANWVAKLAGVPLLGNVLSFLRKLTYWQRASSAMPSYIASRAFVNVLLDLVREKATGVAEAHTDIQTKLDGRAFDETTIASFSADLLKAADGLSEDAKNMSASLRRLVVNFPRTYPVSQARLDVQSFLDAFHEHGLRDAIAAVSTIAGGVGATSADRLQRTLTVLLSDADGDFEKFKQNIEIWFNNAMDRVGGWYKRRSQSIIFILGLAVAVVMNVDTLLIVRFLETNPGSRDALVAQAKSYVSSNTSADSSTSSDKTGVPTFNAGDSYSGTLRLEAAASKDGTVSLTSNTPGVTLVDSTAAVKAGDSDVPYALHTELSGAPADVVITANIAATKGTARLHMNAGLPQQFEAIQSRLMQLDLPIGWARAMRSKAADRVNFKVVPGTVDELLSTTGFHLLGWIITALAATLGAPFWFDMLNRVVSIRSAGKAPEEKPKPPKSVQLPLEPGESPQHAEGASVGQQ